MNKLLWFSMRVTAKITFQLEMLFLGGYRIYGAAEIADLQTILEDAKRIHLMLRLVGDGLVIL